MSWFRISLHGTRLAKITEVRFNKVYATANKRRRELEKSLDADQKSDRQTTETLEGDLKTARKQSPPNPMESGDNNAFLLSLTCGLDRMQPTDDAATALLAEFSTTRN